MSCTYRTALATDAPACVKILVDWIDATEWMPKTHDDPAEMSNWWAQHFDEDHAWVAEVGGSVVGFCSRQRGSNNISALYVVPKHQSHGVGKRLLDLAKEGCNRIIVWAFELNPDARKFYHREGLIEVDREMDDELNIIDVEHRWTRHGVPVQDIIDVLEPQFPNTVITLKKLIPGFQQDLAELSFTAEQHSTSCFLKCFVSHLSWWTGNADSIFERELASMQFFEQASLPVPGVRATGKTCDVSWLLLDAIDGEEISDKPSNFEPEQLAVQLARLHAADLPAETVRALTTCDVHYMETRLREMADQCGCPPAAVDAVVAIVSKFSEQSELVFCHGDLHSHNIFVNKDGVVTFFDFEESVIGYRQYDVASLAYNLKKEFSKAHSDRFLQAYSSESGVQFPENFIDDWREFDSILMLIVGVYVNSLDGNAGLPVCASFVRDNNAAKKRLERILRIRPVRDKLRQLLGDDMWLIRDIDYDAKTGKFDNPNAPKQVIEKLRDANYLSH